MAFNSKNRINELKERLSTIILPDSIDFNKLYEEILSFFSEDMNDFIIRRYTELKKEGFKIKEIYSLISKEVTENLFRGKQLSERQIKRIIYKE
jgi:hypothetical protein